MHKCPDCGRKIGENLPQSFKLAEHLNYMKTARCPGSGRRFVNAGPLPEPPDATPAYDGFSGLSPSVRSQFMALGLLGAIGRRR